MLARIKLPQGRPSAKWVLSMGVVLLAISFIAGSARGPYAISPLELLNVVWDALTGVTETSPQHMVFMNIRLPRLLLGVAAGAALGLSGALSSNQGCSMNLRLRWICNTSTACCSWRDIGPPRRA